MSQVAEYGFPGLWDAIPLGLLPGSRFTTDDFGKLKMCNQCHGTFRLGTCELLTTDYWLRTTDHLTSSARDSGSLLR
jgi:hypothetical protein